MTQTRLDNNDEPKPQRLYSTEMKPWYTHLTLDLIVHVLSRSIFHPAIVLIFYLCLAGLHKHRSPTAYYTLYYAACLAVIEILIWGNRRLTYGRARNVDWSQEVVLVTGGGRGLGRIIVESLVRRGVRIGVLELCEKGEGVNELEDSYDLCWEKCDVSKADQVERAIGKIVDELGPPTILILNAAAPINALPLLPSSTFTSSSPASPTPSSNDISVPPSLTPVQGAQTMAVNTTSLFNLLHSTLPSLMIAATKSNGNGATIVTISSILSHLHPSRLSDYVASKAASSSIHHSLTHEIHSHPDPSIRTKLKTLLVETGQLDTALFSHMSLPWYASFFGPVLDSNDVAKQIINTLARGEGGILRMPFYARVVGGPIWHLIPGSLMVAVRWATGIDSAMVGAGITTVEGQDTRGEK